MALALLSGVLLGLATYLAAELSVHGAVYTLTLNCSGYLFFLLTYHISRAIGNERATGWTLTKECSWLFDGQKFSPFRLYACIQEGVLSVVTYMMFVMSMQYAYYAKVNQGIISCLLSLETMYMSAVAYFWYGEKLQTRQLLGIVLLILCVICLSLSDMFKLSIPLKPHELRGSVFLPILFGVIGPLFFVLRQLSTRAFSKRFGVDATVISTTG